ncbi:MAG: hypothetical protein ACRYG2_07360 [Janthinobacterium lividum]
MSDSSALAACLAHRREPDDKLAQIRALGVGARPPPAGRRAC